MATVFTKEVLLDTLVNMVPLGIMAFFLIAYLLFNPWGAESLLGRVVQIGLILFPFTALSVLTYLAAKRIEG